MRDRRVSFPRAWSRSPWVDVLPAAGVLCAGAVELLAAAPEAHPFDDGHAPLAAAGFLAACAAVAARRRFPAAAGAAFGAILLAEGIAGSVEHGLAARLLALFLLTYSIGASLAPRQAVAGLALVLGLSVAGVALAHSDALVPVLFGAGPWACGRIVRSRQEILARAEQRARELEAEQDAYARLAVRHERARIARELHDVVSHNLAVVVVQAGAGRVATASAAARSADRFAQIRQAGEHGLDELSRLAALLAADADDSEAGAAPLRLDVLIDQARAAGLTVDRAGTIPELRLAPDVEHTAYRVVQEALTNAIKHAPGAALTLRLATRGDVLELEVRDTGDAHAGAGLGGTGSGLGLAGMRERVSRAGGELRAGPDPAGGWRVTARLPLR